MSKIYLTRLVIETQSPMAINTGSRETGFDTQLARDANGLPYIPGTSIAGVWRHLVRDSLGEPTENAWFGSTEESSVITISDGVVHNSENQPVVGLKRISDIERDDLLELLVQKRPHHRERVSINDRGVAKDEGKFDQLLLPTGVRFTIEIQWDDERFNLRNASAENNSSEGNPVDYVAQWQEILNCWKDRRFALGATTRNGLGQIKVMDSEYQEIELARGLNIGKATEVKFGKIKESKLLAELPLIAIDNWRCGVGSELLEENNGNREHTINTMTYSERKIEWDDNEGKLSQKPKPILCGSSIKGILAHRIAYHLRKRKGIWAEDMAECNHEEWQMPPDELKFLFGCVDENNHDENLAGRLWIDDCDIEFEHTVIRHHNSIDRFTGGVRKGALYSEELLYQPKFTIRLWLQPNTKISVELQSALADTINDLKIGLLPMGAGSGRGTSLVMHDTDTEWPDTFDISGNELAESRTEGVSS